MLLLAVSAFAEQLDVNAILAKQKAGATPEALIAAVNDPVNMVAVKTGRSGNSAKRRSARERQSLRSSRNRHGRRSPRHSPPPPAAQPDDMRLTDVVKIVKSGISESLIADHIKQSGLTYKLTMNDLLYLKQNGVQDSVISALLATKDAEAKKAAAPPAETVYSELLLVRGFGPLHCDRPDRLVFKSDTFSWIDGSDPKEMEMLRNNFPRRRSGHRTTNAFRKPS